jgi:D-lactate dehydrogenase
MKVVFFSTKQYDRDYFNSTNSNKHELVFLEPRLTKDTASLADGFNCVCAFVNDVLDEEVLTCLKNGGTQLVALRSAGFNNVDLATAERLGITVCRVPAYSPHAVAEHTVGLILSLNRKLHRAYGRVREGNFSLDGLLGFDLVGRTVGIIGTGKIGLIVAQIMNGFGCKVLAYDVFPNSQSGLNYVDLQTLFAESDVISLHCPLSPDTSYLINSDSLSRMKDGVMLINTSRGAMIDTRAVIKALKSGKVGSLGIDVYEEEADLFFEDLSDKMIQDDTFARLLTFPNVLITGHQAFFTHEALVQIAETTLASIGEFEDSGKCRNAVTAAQIVKAQ